MGRHYPVAAAASKGRAYLISALGNFAAELVDNSQKGLKIRLPGGLPEGLTLEIRLDAVHVKGVVCWSDSGLIKIKLSGMIAVERLASAAAL
jgi:hypothetical protein